MHTRSTAKLDRPTFVTIRTPRAFGKKRGGRGRGAPVGNLNALRPSRLAVTQISSPGVGCEPRRQVNPLSGTEFTVWRLHRGAEVYVTLSDGDVARVCPDPSCCGFSDVFKEEFDRALKSKYWRMRLDSLMKSRAPFVVASPRIVRAPRVETPPPAPASTSPPVDECPQCDAERDIQWYFPVEEEPTAGREDASQKLVQYVNAKIEAAKIYESEFFPRVEIDVAEMNSELQILFGPEDLETGWMQHFAASGWSTRWRGVDNTIVLE